MADQLHNPETRGGPHAPVSPDVRHCEDAVRLAPLYLSGELDPKQPMEQHLAGCSPCSAKMQNWLRLDDDLRQAVPAERVNEANVLDTFRQRALARPSWYRWAAAAAVMVMLAAGAWYLRGPSAQSPSVALAAIADHVREIVQEQPRLWFDDPAKVADLASAQGVSGDMLAQLVPAGYRLEHGKLCRLNGKPYLHLVYENAGEQISVFLHGGEATPPPQGARSVDGKYLFSTGADGRHVAGLQSGDLSVLYVTDEPGDAARLAEQAAEVL